MIQFLRGKKAVSNVIFAVSVAVLLVICVTIGLMGYYQQSNIQSSDNQLQSDYTQLLTDYTQLQSNLSILQSSFEQLSVQYQQLLTSVPFEEGITIDSIYYKPHYLIPSGVYNVTVRNHCSSDVHVTSLKLYHGTTLISSKAVSVTVPTNSAVTIEEFLPFSLTAEIHTLTIETLEGYTVTSDPMSN